MLGIGQITARIAELIRGAMPFAIVNNGTNPDGTARPISLFARIVSYPTLQAAVNAGETNGQKWIQVSAGLYKEVVVITANDYRIEGAGASTIIDGTTVGHAVLVNGDYNHISNLALRTTAGAGNDYHGLSTAGDYNKISECNVINADSDGFVNGAGYWNQYLNCYVATCDRNCFASYQTGVSFVACTATAGAPINLSAGSNFSVVGCRVLSGGTGITTGQSGGLFVGNLTDGSQNLNSNTAAGNHVY